MFTRRVNLYVIFFRFADEVNGEIPEVDHRGRFKRFIFSISLAINSDVNTFVHVERAVHTKEKLKLISLCKYCEQTLLGFIEIFQAFKCKSTCRFSLKLGAKQVNINLRTFFRFMPSVLLKNIIVNHSLHCDAVVR